MTESQMQNVRGNEVAMIFQDPMTSLNPTMTVGRQIAEPVRFHASRSASRSADRALEVLTLVGHAAAGRSGSPTTLTSSPAASASGS